MGVGLIHSQIAKVLDQTKLGRDVIMQGGEGQIQIHQDINLVDFGRVVTTNSDIVHKINLLEHIKLQNIGRGVPVKGVGDESQFCQKFQSGRYAGNVSQQILVQVDDMDRNTGVEFIESYVLECGTGLSSSQASSHPMSVGIRVDADEGGTLGQGFG